MNFVDNVLNDRFDSTLIDVTAGDRAAYCVFYVCNIWLYIFCFWYIMVLNYFDCIDIGVILNYAHSFKNS